MMSVVQLNVLIGWWPYYYHVKGVGKRAMVEVRKKLQSIFGYDLVQVPRAKFPQVRTGWHWSYCHQYHQTTDYIMVYLCVFHSFLFL